RSARAASRAAPRLGRAGLEAPRQAPLRALPVGARSERGARAPASLRTHDTSAALPPPRQEAIWLRDRRALRRAGEGQRYRGRYDVLGRVPAAMLCAMRAAIASWASAVDLPNGLVTRVGRNCGCLRCLIVCSKA